MVHKHKKKIGKKRLTQKFVRRMKTEDMQAMYRAALESVMVTCRNKGGIPFFYKGEWCLLKPFLLQALGDAKEYNQMTAHFNCPGSRNIKAPLKCCMCSWDDLGNTIPPQCDRINLADCSKALSDEAYAARISQHQVWSAWNELPIADLTEGINGMTPFEPLHVHGMGSYKDVIEGINNLIGKKGSKKSEREMMDILFVWVTHDLSRQSERRRPRNANRGGGLDNSRITAVEAKGNALVFLVSLATTRGADIMDPLIKQWNLGIEDDDDSDDEDYKEEEDMEEYAEDVEEEKRLLEESIGQEELDALSAGSLDDDDDDNDDDDDDDDDDNDDDDDDKEVNEEDGDVSMDVDSNDELVDRNGVINTIEMLLCFEEWTKSSTTTKRELEEAGPAVSTLMCHMQRYLPRPVMDAGDGVKEGSNGYHKIKHHAIWSFLTYMKKYGSVRNFDASHGERFHGKEVAGRIGTREGDSLGSRGCLVDRQQATDGGTLDRARKSGQPASGGIRVTRGFAPR